MSEETSPLYNIPLLIVFSFLGLSLVVGLYASKKETTFREYAVGNKRFHTITLVFTVLATIFGGGSLVRSIGNFYYSGVHYVIPIISVCVNIWAISLLSVRMGPFMEHLSLAETIGSIYGKHPRAITAVLGISFCIGVVAIQINVMSSTISICIDSIDHRMVTILATLVFISYNTFGGVRSITITDVLQSVTFMIIISIIIKLLFVKTGKSFLEIILLLKQQEKFQFTNLFRLDASLTKLLSDTLCNAFYLNPSIIHRVYMSYSPIQTYKVFSRVTFSTVIIWVCILLIGLIVFILNPTLQKIEIWPYILANMSPTYKGCLVVCILGMSMSTADSVLHTAAIMVSHDMVESIRGVKAVHSTYQIRLAKLTTIVVGLLSMIITVYCPNLFKLSNFVVTYLMSFFIVAVTPPFILAIFGFRSSTRTALIGMTVGISILLAWESLLEFPLNNFSDFVGIIANSLAMMVAHYSLPQSADKGWMKRNDQQKRIQQLIQAFKMYKKRLDQE